MTGYGEICGVRACGAETVVLGTGAAGLSAADLLKKGGAGDLLIVTEGLEAGTSRNTGSDKQTYYKLSLAGNDLDSVRDLAGDLHKGRCVDGDIALCEAALSAPSFLRLADLGVPFPTNRYGEYIGYKTDHDPHRRATSVGPYTSRLMTECLEKEVRKDGIEILDGFQAVKILVRDNKVKGLVAINRKTAEPIVILCRFLVFATGGPAGIYKMSVYPESQFGATGLALEAGAMGRNLTEWQYGLASLKPRWNVSGSYMQVIPRFVSVDPDGSEHDFLSSYIYSRPEMLSRVFLKGYQWPFDVRKLEKGSSIVDVLCYLETEKGRRVYLDYTRNPDSKDLPWDELSPECSAYLRSSGATGKTPIERLMKLNRPAYDFFLEKGVDLAKRRLEIGLCAQHNNGGLAIDCWWRSNVEGLFPIGEAAASHGVYRPGGSALNAGQCGARRAASWILGHRAEPWRPDPAGCEAAVASAIRMIDNALEGDKDAEAVYSEVRNLMSLRGSVIRNRELMAEALEKVDALMGEFQTIKVGGASSIWLLFELRNALVCQKVYLESMIDHIDHGGRSRGSALYTASGGSVRPKRLDERFTYDLEDEKSASEIQEAIYRDGKTSFSRRPPRPIPQDDDFFERVWARYREDKCVY